MKWLLALETENDPIPACRLMNVFRRKSVKIITLALSAQPSGFSLLAIMDSPEPDVEHVFNFLRGMGGVRQVSYYRSEPGAESSFVLIDSEADSSSVERFLENYPGARLAFATRGKFLYEVESPAGGLTSEFEAPVFLAFSRVRSSVPRPELVATFRNNDEH